MIMTSSLNHGLRASLPHFFGICLGVPTLILAIGFGLGYLFERFSWLHELIQIAGIAYLLYLAWLIANAGPSRLDGERSKPFTFMQAAIFQWVNPKAWIMGTGAIAAYTTVGANVTLQVLTIALVFMLMAFPSAGAWMVFGAGLKRVLKTPSHQKGFNIAMAALLVASIIPVLKELVLKHLT